MLNGLVTVAWQQPPQAQSVKCHVLVFTCDVVLVLKCIESLPVALLALGSYPSPISHLALMAHGPFPH